MNVDTVLSESLCLNASIMAVFAKSIRSLLKPSFSTHSRSMSSKWRGILILLSYSYKSFLSLFFFFSYRFISMFMFSMLSFSCFISFSASSRRMSMSRSSYRCMVACSLNLPFVAYRAPISALSVIVNLT